ncbi:elongation factor 1-beta [Tanacetum coccineum]|uniref:Elongation factor 1-beta n=1 Tax=Tanacetum coccineum TaxID=301880 RepID=A0ABQ4XUB9_9ASTR
MRFIYGNEKPWDDETDMKKLEEAVRSVELPGLLWGAHGAGDGKRFSLSVSGVLLVVWVHWFRSAMRHGDSLIYRRQLNLITTEAHAEKRSKSLEQRADTIGRADALRSLANALDQWADEYLRKADAYGWRAQPSVQRLEKFDKSILFLTKAIMNFVV